mgnify:CR=1 FL=1
MDRPFAYDNYVTGKSFVGRKMDCNILGNLLDKGEHVVIYDPPKSGKMSVIQQTLFNMRAAGKQFSVVRVNLFNVRTIEQFLIKFGTAVIRPMYSTSVEYMSVVERYLSGTHFLFDADRFGLSQLHQLRGRVGRSTRHAYAYFTYKPDKNLSEVAEKRLSAIRDFAEFGSGFKIAMRDLEIRGAGNLLGAEQSGHMMSVGYDMYLKLLDEAVLEEKGEAPKAPECTADLNVTANIAKDYVERGEERMDLYRRMAAIRSDEDADDLLDEIVDRYGEPPRGVLNLVDIALLRAKAKECAVTDIRQKGSEVWFTLAQLNFDAVSKICSDADYQKRVQFVASAKVPTLRLKLVPKVDPLKQTKVFVEKYRTLCAETP